MYDTFIEQGAQMKELQEQLNMLKINNMQQTLKDESTFFRTCSKTHHGTQNCFYNKKKLYSQVSITSNNFLRHRFTRKLQGTHITLQIQRATHKPISLIISNTAT